MHKAMYRMAGFIVVFALLFGSYGRTRAAGNDYYVSTTGNDSNAGTASAPFRTFAKANSMLSAGSTLYIQPGVYNEQLKITKSGTGSAWITVKPAGGAVVIDLQYAADSAVELRGSYTTLNGLEVRNSGNICVNIAGSNVTVDNLTVHGCTHHGIQASSASQVKILNSRVYHASMSNAAGALTSGWASGIKVLVSDNVLIQGNTVYNNHGEGMGTRGTNVTIRNNTVYDNFSVNIYTNSENATIERNFVYCTPNSGFERDGLPAAGITMGEEYFEGWGARLKNARVLNNIVAYCKHGVRYNGADDLLTGGGLKNATIAYNTLYGSVNSALSIVYESAQAGSLIADNIIWQADNKLSTVDNTAGLTFHNNLWKVLPAASLRGPGDRTGNPNFQSAPGYSPESYRLGSSSPAIGGAADIGIANDFFGSSRGPSFDMGAAQSSGSGPAPTAVPTQTAVAASPTPIPPAVAPTNPPTMPSPTAVAQPTRQVSGETVYDNRNSALVYSAGWKQVTKAAAYEGSFAQTSKNGSSVTLQFTGSSFTVIYKGGPSFRKMDVYVDNVLVGTIDQRNSASKYQMRWDLPGQLAPGSHTLKLVFVTTSSSTNGSVDAVIVR